MLKINDIRKTLEEKHDLERKKRTDQIKMENKENCTQVKCLTEQQKHEELEQDRDNLYTIVKNGVKRDFDQSRLKGGSLN